MADQLSPANQVMIAVAYVYQEHGGEPPARAVAAAALRAAALQIENSSDGRGCLDILRQIAAELENHQ